MPFPSLIDLPDSGIKSASPALPEDSLPLSRLENPQQGYVLSTRLITIDTDLGHLTEVVPVRFLHCHVTLPHCPSPYCVGYVAWLVGSSSPTRDQTHAPCSGSMKS